MEAVERKSRLTIHGTFSCFFHLGNVVLGLSLMVIGVTLRQSGSTMPQGYWSFSMVGAMATLIGSLAAAFPLIFMATIGCSHRGNIIIILTTVLLSGFLWSVRPNPILSDQAVVSLQVNLVEMIDNPRNGRLDRIQKQFRCCGVDGHKDWLHTKIPKSCCRQDLIATCDVQDPSNLVDRGCLSSISSSIQVSIRLFDSVVLYVSMYNLVLTCIMIFTIFLRKLSLKSSLSSSV